MPILGSDSRITRRIRHCEFRRRNSRRSSHATEARASVLRGRKTGPSGKRIDDPGWDNNYLANSAVHVWQLRLTWGIDAATAPMGATLAEGGATFRVWAPTAKSVSVAGNFNNWTQQRLDRADTGFWSLY